MSVASTVLLACCSSLAAAPEQAPDSKAPRTQHSQSGQTLDNQFHAASADFDAGQFAEAAALLETLVRKVPNSFEVHEMLGLSYSMVIVFNMTGPFIIEHHLSFSPVTAGYCSFILGIAWMLGGFAGKATINRPFYKKLFINLFLQITFITAMLISLNFQVNLYTLIFFAFIIHVTAGFTFNNYFSYSLSLFPKNAGIASGLSGGVNYITVSLLSYGIVYFIPEKDENNLAYSYLILILLSALVMFFVYKINRKRKDPATQITG